MSVRTYEERATSTSGRGIFAATDLRSSSLVLQDSEAFVAALDSPHLTNACAWCFVYLGEANPEDHIKLSACSGCKIVRYCSKVRVLLLGH